MRKILCLFLAVLIWLVTATSATAMFTNPTMDLPAGQAKFVTCLTGIKNKSRLFAGLQIATNSGWTIQDVQLKWTTSGGEEGAGFIPQQQDLPTIPLFPVIFTFKQAATPVTFFVNGIITGCQEQNCQDFPVALATTLPNSFAFHTPDCAGILFALKNSPIPHVPHTSHIVIAFWVIVLALLMSIISPLFMVWGCHWQKQEKLFQKFCRYIQLVIAITIMVGIGISPFPELWTTMPLNKNLTALIMIFVFMGARSSPFLTLIGILFMPKPGIELLQQYSLYARIAFVCLWGAVWMTLFQIQYIHAHKIYSFLKKWHRQTPKSVQFSFALPWILLFLYMLIYL